MERKTDVDANNTDEAIANSSNNADKRVAIEPDVTIAKVVKEDNKEKAKEPSPQIKIKDFAKMPEVPQVDVAATALLGARRKLSTSTNRYYIVPELLTIVDLVDYSTLKSQSTSRFWSSSTSPTCCWQSSGRIID